ncbi:MAG: PKD domain-containing protein, partial [Thermodesulfobacteria bacterium]|nr:PKD domain-containing protein [Thermodesulfobacteriota bacterium]
KMQGLEEMQSLGVQGPRLDGSNVQSLATDVQVSGPPKIISFEARPSQVDNPGTPVTFTIQASGLGELEFSVDFGDKSPQGQGATVKHVYTKAGTYVATAKVKDAQGRIVEKSVTIDVKDRKPRAPKAIKILRIGR